MNPDAPLSGKRVLVVEDDYYLAMDTREWLENAGATVMGPMSCVEDATKFLSSSTPDCAVVDINLGRGPAFTIADELLDRRIPFLFATGYDENSIPHEYHGTPRLQKPIRESDLVRAVELLGEAARILP